MSICLLYANVCFLISRTAFVCFLERKWKNIYGQLFYPGYASWEKSFLLTGGFVTPCRGCLHQLNLKANILKLQGIWLFFGTSHTWISSLCFISNFFLMFLLQGSEIVSLFLWSAICIMDMKTNWIISQHASLLASRFSSLLFPPVRVKLYHCYSYDEMICLIAFIH